MYRVGDVVAYAEEPDGIRGTVIRIGSGPRGTASYTVRWADQYEGTYYDYDLTLISTANNKKLTFGRRVKIKKTGRLGTIDNIVGKGKILIRTGAVTVREFKRSEFILYNQT